MYRYSYNITKICMIFSIKLNQPKYFVDSISQANTWTIEQYCCD